MGITMTKSSAKKLDPNTIKAFDEFVNQFKSESDRSAVILVTAKIDYSLFQLISCFLVPSTTKKDELLDPDENGPLSSFSARISLCYRLGLIDSEFTKALHLVRRIRNEFAHEVNDARLDVSPHRERIRELTKIVSATEMFDDVKDTYFFDKTGVSGDFFTVLTMLAVRLDTLFYKVKPITSKPAYSIVPNNYISPKQR